MSPVIGNLGLFIIAYSESPKGFGRDLRFPTTVGRVRILGNNLTPL